MSDENDKHNEGLKTKALEQQDLVAALNGTPNGRLMRFGAVEQYNQQQQDKDWRKQNQAEMLRLSAAYQALFSQTMQNLHDTRDAVYTARLQAAAGLDNAQAKLKQTIAEANKTADGEVVFRAADGQIYDRNHQTINGAILDGVNWRDDAPSWEDYQERVADVELHQSKFERMVKHEERLDKIQAIMDNEENPPTMDELKSLNEEITTIIQDTKRGQTIAAEAIQKPLSASIPDLKL